MLATTLASFSASAQSDPPHIRRDQLLAKAADEKTTAHEYIEILKKARHEIPPIGSRYYEQYLFDWIYALDPLWNFGKSKLQTEIPHGELRDFAKEITRGARDLLNYADVPDYVFLQQFLFWSEGIIRVYVTQRQGYFVKNDGRSISDPAERQKRMLYWHLQLAKIAQEIKILHEQGNPRGKEFEDDVVSFEDTMNTLGQADGQAVRKLLENMESVADSEIDAIIDNCLGEATIIAVLDRMKIIPKTLTDKVRLEKIVRWSLSLSGKIKQSGSDNEGDLQVIAGSILMKAFKRLLRQGYILADEYVVPIVRLVKTTDQVEEFVRGLGEVFREKLIADSQIKFIFSVATELRRLVNFDPYHDLGAFFNSATIQMKTRELAWEGSYNLNIGGIEARMTLAHNGENLFANIVIFNMTHLANRGDGSRIYFPRLFYDVRTDTLGARSERGDKAISFRLKQASISTAAAPRNEIYNGSIASNLLGDGSRTFTGTQDQSLRDDLLFIPRLEDEGTGLPTLDIKFAEVGGEHQRLRIKEIGDNVIEATFLPGQWLGAPAAVNVNQFSFSPGSVFIDRHKRYFFLTTEEDQGRVFQVRGQITPDGHEFVGYYMIGGLGFRRLHLYRAKL